MKVEELFEQERSIRTALTQRAGVIGLMLHQTIDHNPMARMPRRRSAAEEASAASRLAARRLDHDYGEQRAAAAAAGVGGVTVAGVAAGGTSHTPLQPVQPRPHVSLYKDAGGIMKKAQAVK